MKNKLLTFSTTVLLVVAGPSTQAQNWLINGNNGITAANFLGTRNNQHLKFRTNNVERMRLTTNGQLGLGITNPTYALQIQNPNWLRGISVTNNFSGNQTRIGIYSSSITAPGYGYGLLAEGGQYGGYFTGEGGNASHGVRGLSGLATGSAGDRYGVDGGAVGGSNNYGVYGFAGGGSFNAAGYFPGDVWAASYNFISDRKFKTGITQLKNSASLEQLMKLKPTAYEFNAAAYPGMELPKGKQIGLIADEVKQVFPELVKPAVHPAKYGKDRNEVLQKAERYEGINYTGLIPVLIASIQEQQKTIEEQQKTILQHHKTIENLESEKETIKKENQEFKSRLDKIEQMLALNYKQISSPVTLTDAQLEQNAPNPFNRNTMINYYLPQKISNAVINITDMNGKLIKTMSLTTSGKGQLVLEAGQLTLGTYEYSLIVNGKLVDTKKMVLTK